MEKEFFIRGTRTDKKKSKNNFCLTSKGRKFRIVSNGCPKGGDYYLKPTKNKNEYEILQLPLTHNCNTGYYIIEFWE